VFFGTPVAFLLVVIYESSSVTFKYEVTISFCKWIVDFFSFEFGFWYILFIEFSLFIFKSEYLMIIYFFFLGLGK
jgi:hypothetical protein